MNIKILLGAVVIIGALIFGAISFVQTNVEYATFRAAMSAQKKVHVKGGWMKERESSFNADAGQFAFFMKDDDGQEVKVVFDGAKPNNFEIAEAVVVTGRFEDGYFHATEILTKCPSKYEADAESMKKTL
jgi:cytochrome c-type biogenesis protein CcmE